MRAALVLAAAVLLLAAGAARGALPDCPEDRPYGTCDAGNACERPDACGPDQWCKLDCGCDFKCLSNDVVEIANAPRRTGGLGRLVGRLGRQSGANATAGAAAAAAPAPAGARAPRGPFGALALPAAAPHVLNLTALLAGVHESLTSSVRDAAMRSMLVTPTLCPNSSLPAVQCAASSCDAAPCGAAQVCVPECGSCSRHRCVDVDLPQPPKLPVLPHLALPKLPGGGAFKSPCANNEAIDLPATLHTVPATLLMSQSHRVSITCSGCKPGTVSRQPAFHCTLCLPGTYADREAAVCRKCPRGSFATMPASTSCTPCGAETFAPLPGSWACIPCPPGFTTSGQLGQPSCSFEGFKP
ncbi:hypothetical protein Rsub_04011 [Raphidocelis subcapitata]|uniref:Tyrosine-protein kinase ephrin type A/B receptor-like domain-containing protein n=1 Tax=Raphidocelis subcapitata TaxID=307507 RepID=A0A2V0P3C2_9CHLO|nr:hypothetical protein Rsub_04011 [Raphidocelis subcapitata]|eukprot:GBF91707.1 hypothetical protein Rsub_04011 [Raphidocelis subcapitata]